MMKKLVIIASILMLAACVTGGGYGSGTPWEQYVYNKPAQAAPSPLAGPQTPPPPQEVAQSTYAAAPETAPATPSYGANDYQYSSYTPPQPDSRYAAPATGYDYTASQQYDTAAATPPAGAVYAIPAPPPVKVALLVPLSGKQADLGQAMLQAAQLALFDAGYESFELMPRDSGDTPDSAVKAAQSALDDGAQLLLGPVFSSSVSAVKPLAASRNVSMIAFSTDWTLAGGNTFIMGFLPFGQVQRTLEYAASLGLRRIGILAPDNAYGNAVLAAYNAAAYKLGFITVDSVRYPESQTDLSDIVRRFARYDERMARRANETDPLPPPPFDAVLMPVGGERARTIGALLSYYELPPQTVRRLGTGLWDDPALAADKSLAGGLFAAPAPDQRRGFEKRYVDSYGPRPPRLASLAYDATALSAVLARSGYERGGRQPAFDRYSLSNPNGFAGIDGVFRFRPDGLVERGLAVQEFRNGRIEVVSPAPQTFQNWMGQ